MATSSVTRVYVLL